MDVIDVLPVAAPIAAVVGVLFAVSRATGGSRTTRIVEAVEVHRALLDADITFVPAETVIGADGYSALVADLASGALGVAYVIGDRVAARRLCAPDIRTARWDDEPDGSLMLRIRMHDFGCPELAVRLQRADVARWRPRVDAVLRDLPSDSQP